MTEKTKLDLRSLPIVEVDFADPCLASGWREPVAATKDSFSKCKAAGYLLDLTDEHLQICLAITIDEDCAEVNGVFSIPTASISDLHVLKQGKNGNTIRSIVRSRRFLRPKRRKGDRKAHSKPRRNRSTGPR